MIARSMTSYRVMDLRSDTIDILEHNVPAKSPEDAARTVLGLELVRSGRKPDLVARVYWQTDGQPMNMVRLYSKVAERLR